MNVLVLQGSPRADGNTQALVELVLAGVHHAGGQHQVIQLSEQRNITGCEECYQCQNGRQEDGCCDLQDDMQGILEQLLEADVIVWATPVFCLMPSWLLKIALDRTYCLFEFGDDGGISSALSGRRMAAIVTCGSAADDNADLTVEALRRYSAFAGCTWLGTCVADGVTNRRSIRRDEALRKRAHSFGAALVDPDAARA